MFIEYIIPFTTSLTCIKFLLKWGSKRINFLFFSDLKTKLFKTSRPKSALIINEACEKGFFHLEKTSKDQRIKNIKNKLSKSHKQREINRYSRKKSNKTLVALVGYTNAGKTTLFNLLTESQLYVANKLFATLDSVTRKNSVSGLEDVLFSDTVGFISDLPTELIESFKATLDELKSADILVHVVDISDPDFIYKTEQVFLILKELGISNIPCIRVNNKSDKVDIDEISEGTSNNNNEVWVSALKNTGMENLVNSIQFNRKKFMIKEWIELQPNQGKIRSKLYSLGRVLEETTSERGLIQLQLEIDKSELNSLISNKGIDLKNNKIKEAI